MFSFFSFHYTTCLVLYGTTVLGICCGILGTFAFLRKQSLLGDAMSHAALPGIALMFILTHTRSPALLLCGGGISSILGAVCISEITARTYLKRDTAFAIVLSVFFGCGLVLLTLLQQQNVSGQAILNKFLFGSAATLLPEDIFLITFTTLVVLGSIYSCYKELTLFSFDPSLCHSLGYSTKLLETILTILLTITILIGLQTVGVVLMSSLLIGPAVAAYQWTTRIQSMLVLSAIFGASSCALGAVVSSNMQHIPTGPTIVVIISCIALVSLALGLRTSHESEHA